MKNSVGFTLIEFLITMVLSALFLTMAIPAYYSVIQNNRVVSMVNNLSAGIQYARMEAIKRGSKVSICSSANTSLTTCGTVTQWIQGWIVFLDPDNNNLVDSTSNLIKVNETLPPGSVVTASNSIISFDGSGFLTSGAFTMTVSASGCTGNNARVLNISTSGRVNITNAKCN